MVDALPGTDRGDARSPGCDQPLEGHAPVDEQPQAEGLYASCWARLAGDAEAAGYLCPRESDPTQTRGSGVGRPVNFGGRRDEIAWALDVPAAMRRT
jgi:hypothetical protein